jgi:hypothetical protein
MPVLGSTNILYVEPKVAALDQKGEREMDKAHELAVEGTQPAYLIAVTAKLAKTGKNFFVLRFQILNQKPSATALVFSESPEEKAFLLCVPGYHGTALDELQLLGRSAEVTVIHTQDLSGKIFANVDLASIEWEPEAERPDEPNDDSNAVILICGAHPANGELKPGKYFYRRVGQTEIHVKEVECRSVYEVVVTGVRSLLRSATAKKARLRIFTDVQPAAQALKEEATASRCSIHWKSGVELKRMLFRGLRTPYVATKRPAAHVTATETDELEELLG